MSLNTYDSSSGTLTTIASASRLWTGTKAQYDAQKTAGTLPNNCLIVITDDEVEMDTVPTEGSPVAVTSNGIYNALPSLSILSVDNETYVEGDGTKTLQTLLYELHQNYAVIAGALEDDEKMLITAVTIPSLFGSTPTHNFARFLGKTNTNATFFFQYNLSTSTTCESAAVTCAEALSAQTAGKISVNYSNNAVTATNYINNVIPNGTKITLKYDLYKVK